MNRKSLRSLAIGTVVTLLSVPGSLLGQAETPSGRIGAVLDDWHAAAAAADEERYFAHFAPGAVFLGTDAAERWTVEEFRRYAHPYFAKGKAWTFRAVSRHVAFSADGSVAWFDEALDTPNLGPARGSGVLVRTAGAPGSGLPAAWKIAHYDLSVPIPNDLMKEIKAKIDTQRRAPATPSR